MLVNLLLLVSKTVNIVLLDLRIFIEFLQHLIVSLSLRLTHIQQKVWIILYLVVIGIILLIKSLFARNFFEGRSINKDRFVDISVNLQFDWLFIIL